MAAGGDELAPLDGYRVAVTADRRAAELAELLARKGADVLLAPAIRTLPLGDEDSLRRVTEEVVELPPTLVLAITGIGMRSWFGAAEAWGLDSQLRESLRLARTVARGPKAAAAVLQAGLEVWRQEPTERLGPLVAALERDGDLDGARVALQLPGEDLPEAVATMAGAGAVVTAVPVYRWVQPEDPSPVIRLVQAAIAGRVDAVTFTSGLPALAVTNGSPAAARWTNRDRWVLASLILTVSMWASLRRDGALRCLSGETAAWRPQCA